MKIFHATDSEADPQTTGEKIIIKNRTEQV